MIQKPIALSFAAALVANVAYANNTIDLVKVADHIFWKGGLGAFSILLLWGAMIALVSAAMHFCAAPIKTERHPRRE
ncbi:hypothetical protein NIG5292_00817 [Nereida ignava]|uniref:Uncharacterized protein n=1 Tax=Nereida ignava TaxID=282199 RepID=A0A0U1NJ81_9RHOB|nr:hypothetical protein [Nereida ignava]CRK74780.1 hypothetical protein NIG5292_00817 [Nereida ignava]SFJ87383.1 hypothetical protein SAMN02745667_02643 [Nereida ignava DSM 16309]